MLYTSSVQFSVKMKMLMVIEYTMVCVCVCVCTKSLQSGTTLQLHGL